MADKKQLVLIGGQQFGYRYDTDRFCEYLADEFDITYICFDEGKPKVENGLTHVVYLSIVNKFIRWFRFINSVIREARKNKNSVVYLSYFLGCSLICIFLPTHKVIMDHRSGSVTKKEFKNSVLNFIMRIESVFTKNVVALTTDLKEFLHLPKNTIVFPLGSDILSETNKSFESLDLLYVGVLKGREIHKTIFGVSEFRKKHPDISISYSIIGGGDQKLINEEIEKYNLMDVVQVLGFVPFNQITGYYENCNVGICYAPMSKYYMPQPFSKLYEYTLSGMAVISVRLLDSIRKINKDNGVLCDDTPESFAWALEQIYQNRKNYNSEHIRQEFADFTWKKLSEQFREIING